MTSNEKRSYYRIEDKIALKLRKISEEEFNLLEHSIRYTPASSFITSDEIPVLKEIEVDEEKKKDPLFTYMKIIDRKLDMVLDYLSEKAEDTLQYISRYLKANISGSGIRFVVDVDMNEGDYVELIIILPIYPHSRISVLCKVLRSIKQTQGNCIFSDIALQYLAINENNRDMLIQYIFMKEREMLRNKRESTG